jgi:hypothetical protein
MAGHGKPPKDKKVAKSDAKSKWTIWLCEIELLNLFRKLAIALSIVSGKLRIAWRQSP